MSINKIFEEFESAADGIEKIFLRIKDSHPVAAGKLIDAFNGKGPQFQEESSAAWYAREKYLIDWLNENPNVLTPEETATVRKTSELSRKYIDAFNGKI